MATTAIPSATIPSLKVPASGKPAKTTPVGSDTGSVPSLGMLFARLLGELAERNGTEESETNTRAGSHSTTLADVNNDRRGQRQEGESEASAGRDSKQDPVADSLKLVSGLQTNTVTLIRRKTVSPVADPDAQSSADQEPVIPSRLVRANVPADLRLAQRATDRHVEARQPVQASAAAKPALHESHFALQIPFRQSRKRPSESETTDNGGQDPQPVSAAATASSESSRTKIGSASSRGLAPATGELAKEKHWIPLLSAPETATGAVHTSSSYREPDKIASREEVRTRDAGEEAHPSIVPFIRGRVDARPKQHERDDKPGPRRFSTPHSVSQNDLAAGPVMQVVAAAPPSPGPAERTGDMSGPSMLSAGSQPNGHSAAELKIVPTVALANGGRPEMSSGSQNATLSAVPVEVPAISAEDGEVRISPERARKPGELAFTARLTALSDFREVSPTPHRQSPLPQEASRPDEVPTAPNTTSGVISEQEETSSLPAVHEIKPTTDRTNPERQREQQANPTTAQAIHATVVPVAQEFGSPIAAERPSVQPQRESMLEAPRTQPEIKAEPHAEPPRSQAATHEIRLELAGNNHRVELKVSDRGGEVKVAVRTPDNHLADRLRDNLPALSSRLSENGIRTETWHPASASNERWRHTPETATTNSGDQQDAQPQQQNREQARDEAPKRPRANDDEQTKGKGKDFEWLLSTIH